MGRSYTAVEICKQQAGYPGKQPCDNKGDIFIEPGIVTQRAHSRFTIADALQSIPNGEFMSRYSKK